MAVGVGVAVGVKVGVTTGVEDGVGVGVAVDVAVGVGVGVGIGVSVGVGVKVGVGVGVGVKVGVGVRVGVGVAVGAGVGVVDKHDSLPIVMNDPGEFWLLYSAVIQAADRAVLQIRTSSTSPLNRKSPYLDPIAALEIEIEEGLALLGPAISEPFL